MPQLQVVNTGASPMSTALGNIGAGFIESFNKRSEQARNDEIFSRIKSKYGPDVDPDTVYKDVLQTQGFDESYKKNTLAMIKELGALQRSKDRTLYEDTVLDLRKKELGLKIAKANQDPSEKPLTPYQEQTLKNRKRYLDLQERKVNDAMEKGAKSLPKDFANYSNAVFRLSKDAIPPEDKAFVDRIGVQKLNEGADLQTAFSVALQALNARKDLIKDAIPPENPDTSRFTSAAPKEIENAKSQLFDFLRQAKDAGVTSQKDLRAIARRGKWSDKDITQVLQKLFQNPNDVKPTVSQEEVNRVLFGA